MARLVASLLTLAGLVGCGGSEWVEITAVQASSPDATTITLLLDVCHPSEDSAPLEALVESEAEVRVTRALRYTGDDRDDCAGAAAVELDAEIGDRTVVDERAGTRFTVTLGPPDWVPPPSASAPTPP